MLPGNWDKLHPPRRVMSPRAQIMQIHVLGNVRLQRSMAGSAVYLDSFAEYVEGGHIVVFLGGSRRWAI